MQPYLSIAYTRFMPPILKYQLLPVAAGLLVMAVAYWMGGAEGVIRAYGLLFAAGNVFLIAVLWRPRSRVPRTTRLYVVTAMNLGAIAIGLAVAGPLGLGSPPDALRASLPAGKA